MILLLLAAIGLAVPDTPREALTKQIVELRREAARAVPEAGRAAVEAQLGRAEAALAAGRLYLAVYEFENAFETTRAFAFAADSAGVDTFAAFSDRWRALGEPVASPSPRSRRPPAVVDALAVAARSRAAATYRASLPYAEDAGVRAGLYYLGEARALPEFASFALSLDWPEPASPPQWRSIATELDALDAEMTKTYEGMSREQHPAYVLASATLKRARALEERGFRPAALFEYLMARYQFAPLRPRPAAGSRAAGALAAQKAQFDDNTDHSIALFFMQLAESAPSQDAAAVIFEDVLPAYRAALAAPPSAATSAADARVTITLVRWPYT